MASQSGSVLYRGPWETARGHQSQDVSVAHQGSIISFDLTVQTFFTFSFSFQLRTDGTHAVAQHPFSISDSPLPVPACLSTLRSITLHDFFGASFPQTITSAFCRACKSESKKFGEWLNENRLRGVLSQPLRRPYNAMVVETRMKTNLRLKMMSQRMGIAL